MAMNPGSSGTEMSEINVTPFVDVMLVLLVIFMVAAPMLEKSDEKRKVEMNLPVTRKNTNTVDPKETDQFILEVTESLKVRVGDEVIVDCSDKKEGDDPKRFEPCFDEIEKKLGNNPKLAEQQTLYLLADANIPYGFVVGTMARIKRAGIAKLGMVTNPEYLPSPEPESAPSESSDGSGE